ncbi:MAG: AAA family ATPase [Bacteroidales bacterium]|nr:AAA family ATPase [Bacteroidales bacterium]
MNSFNRKALEVLREWRTSDIRKPLILRGARQVGKTTLVKDFAKEFDVFLHLNLEKEEDRLLFEKYHDVHELIRAIFLFKNKVYTQKNVLLFIDEIQNSTKAVAILRYFYEEANFIHVITAGSLLETLMDLRKISFPVGRVEYLALRPCSFLEFMGAMNNFDLPYIENIDVENVQHNRIMRCFRDYTLCGGMPAAIVQYLKNMDILSVAPIYESLLDSYKDDVEKYTASQTIIKVIRAILTSGWQCAAETISFEGFAGTKYKSREMSEAFQTISKAMLLELVYPSSNVVLPTMPNMRKHPKLLWLDTGLVNYASGIQQDVFSVDSITDVWRGRIAEHIVGQEILTLSDSVSQKRQYWRCDKIGSEAEVDFVYTYKGLLIPVEVKSGHNAKLKSLHSFMDSTPHDVAIRVWSQPFSIDTIKTQKGKTFRLINIPFYYVGVLPKLLDKVIESNMMIYNV